MSVALKIKKNGTMYDITDYTIDIKWGGSKTEVARKLEVSIINPSTDPENKAIYPAVMDFVCFCENDDELFEGFITEVSIDKDKVSFTAYDILWYLTKSTTNYNFKNVTPEWIAKTAIADAGLTAGTIFATGRTYDVIVKDKSLYDAILYGYKKDKKTTGNKYRIFAEKGKINIDRIGDVWCEHELADDRNLTSISSKKNMSDVVTRVKIFDKNEQFVKNVDRADLIKKYGIIQKTGSVEENENPDDVAKNEFNGASASLEVQGIGDAEYITGKCVKLLDGATGKSGEYYISADTHTWSAGNHTMQLSLDKHSVY